MAIENLNPIRTEEEAREKGRLGGIASGKKRKENKLLKECFEQILALPLKNEQLKKQIAELGIKDKEINNKMAMAIAQFQRALKSDKAFEIIRDTVGEKPTDNINLTGSVNNPYENLSEEELRKLTEEKANDDSSVC